MGKGGQIHSTDGNQTFDVEYPIKYTDIEL